MTRLAVLRRNPRIAFVAAMLACMPAVWVKADPGQIAGCPDAPVGGPQGVVHRHHSGLSQIHARAIQAQTGRTGGTADRNQQHVVRDGGLVVEDDRVGADAGHRPAQPYVHLVGPQRLEHDLRGGRILAGEQAIRRFDDRDLGPQ